MNPSGGSDRSTPGNPVREQSITFDALNTGPLAGDLDADLDSTRAIIDAEERKARQQQQAHQALQNRRRAIKFAVIGTLLLVGLAIVALRHNVSNKTLESANADASQRYATTSIPLGSLATNSSALSVENAQTLSINGQLNVNNSLVLAPTTQPNGAVTGQLYYNQANNQLEYYNGSSYQNLVSGNQVVNTSLGGASGKIAAGSGVSVSGGTLNNTGVLAVGGQSGNIALGSGLSASGGSLNNTGVLTLQGEAGNVTLAAGPGIVVNGTTLSNSGLLSLGGQNGNIGIGSGLAIDNGTLHNTGIISATGAGLITVTNDGNGNIIIDGPNGGVGSGTVASAGGTINSIAKFTGVQTIADSLISDNGTTVTIGGALDVTGGVTLSSPLTVANGGTGGTTQATARAGIGAAASGANNDITSLTGLTTALSVSQGGTGVGVLPTNNVLVGNGTSGITGVTTATAGQCLVSTAGAPVFQTCPGSGGVASINSLTGALTLAGTGAGSVSSAGSTITINDATNAVKGLASFNATDLKVTNGNVDTIQGISTTSSPTFGQLTLTSSQAAADMLSVNNTNNSATGNLLNLELNGSSKLSVNPSGNLILAGTVNGQTIGNSSSFTGNVTVGNTLSVNTITPTGALTVGVGSQAFTLQGNTSSAISATNGTNTTTVGFQSPTANVTYDFAAAAVGTYNICTTAGNCVGLGGGVTSSGGTTNTLPLFTGSNTLGNSIITQSGTTATIGGTLSVNTITPTGALTVGSVGQNLTLQGATVSVADNAGGTTNSLAFSAPSGANKIVTIPNASGTVAVSATGPISLDSSGNLTCPTCLTSGGSGGTAGVSSINSQTGAITLQGTNASSITTAGTTITVNDATAAIKGLASFNATDLKVTSGNVDTIQSIAVSATPTFAGLTLSSALTVANGGTGGTTQATARSGIGAAASGANSDITSLSGLTTALSVLQGGTGATSLTANGVLVGNGTSPVSSVTGSNGQCLMMVAGTPAFGACPGGGSSPVTSLDGLTGALTINNSTGLGSAITINNAKANGTTEGIATFSGTDFQDNGSGVIDTIQSIATGASPTFAGLTLSSPLSVANGGTGGTTQATARTGIGAAKSGANSDITSLSGLTTALSVSQGGTGITALTANELLYASSTSSVGQLGFGNSGQCLLSNGNGNAPSWQTCTGAGGVSSIDGLSGSVTLANSAGSLGTITINNAAADGATKGIAAFNATNFTAASGVVNTVQGIATSSTPQFAGLNLSTALTVGNGGTGLSTLTAFGILYASSSSAISQLGLGTSGQCLMSNGAGSAASWQTCPGSGGGGITGSGTSGKLAVFNATGSITSSDITDTSGTSVGIASGVSLQVLGSAQFENSANSTTAFQVQNASGASIFNVDTTNGIVGTAATSVASTNSQNFVIQSGNATGTTSTAGNVSIDVGTSTTSSGSINIGNTNAGTINISNNAETASAITPKVYIQSPNSANAGSIYTTNIGVISTGESVVTIGAKGAAQSASEVVLQSPGITETITNASDTVKSSSNSTTAFSVQNSSSVSVLNVDASSSRVTVNSNGTPLYLNMTGANEENGIVYQTTGSTTGEVGIAGATGQIITQAVSGDLGLKSSAGNILLAAGGTTAEEIIDTNGDTTFKNKTNSATSNAFMVQNASGINLISVNTGAATPTVNIGANGSDVLAAAVNIGTSTGTTQQVTVGSTVSGSITSIQGGSGGVSVNTSTGSSINLGNSFNDVINIGNTSSNSAITLQGNGISQTITGSSTNPSDLIKTSTNSNVAFQIQNASGYNELNVSTSGNLLTLGNKTSTAGQGIAGSVAFADGTSDNNAVTLTGPSAGLSSSYTLQLPTLGSSSGECLQSAGGSSASNTILTFASCTGGSGINLQQAYNASGGATPDIDMTSSFKGFTIQNDNSAPITGELFGVHGSVSSGLGASLFSVANTGDTSITSNDATSAGVAFTITSSEQQGTAISDVANSITSGTAFNVSANALTTGSGINLTTSSAAQSSGSLLNVNDSATLATNGGTVSGNLVNVSRSLTANIPGGTTTAPALDTTGTGPQSTSEHFSLSTWTNSFTVGSHANTFLLAQVAYEGSCGTYRIGTVTYNGAGMSLIGYSDGAGWCLSFYGLTAPATGSSDSLVVTSAGGVGLEMSMNISAWYNVNQTSPYNTTGNGIYSNATGSTPVTALGASSQSGQTVVDMLLDQTNVSTTPTTTQTGQNAMSVINDTVNNFDQIADSYRSANASGTSTTMGWSTLGSYTGAYVWAQASIGLNPVVNTIVSETVSAPVASFSNNCTTTGGGSSICNDATNVLQLSQLYSQSTGAVLNIQNAGTGDMLDMSSNGTLVSKITSNGDALFKDITSGGNTTAFQIQNNSGYRVLTANTVNNSVLLGQSSQVNGTLAFADSGDANTISLGTNSSGTLAITVPGGSGTDYFGNSDLAGSTDDTNDNGLYNCSLFTATRSGSVTAITVAYANVKLGDVAQAAIYTNTSGNPGSRLAYSNSVTLDAAGEWNTFPLTNGSATATNGTSYWLCTTSDSASGSTDTLSYTVGTASQQKDYTMSSYGTWPSSLSSPTFTSDIPYVMYASYTVTGSTTAAVSVSNSGSVALQNSADSTSALNVQDSSGNSLLNVDSTNKAVNVNNAFLNVNGLANPQTPSLTTSSSGGSLGSGYYYYAIEAIDPYGNTTGATAAQTSSGGLYEQITSGASNENTVTWSPVSGATGYEVWRCEAGNTTTCTPSSNSPWNYVSVSSATTTYTDTSSSTWTSSNGGEPNWYGDNSTTGINMASGSTINFDGGTNGTNNALIGFQPADGLGQGGSSALLIGNYQSNGNGNVVVNSGGFEYADTTTWTQDFGVNDSGAMVRSGVNATDAFEVFDSNWDVALTVNTNNVTASGSGTAAVIKVGKNSTNNDSIVAAGAILSNQGDYAEYFTQATPDGVQPGDVVCLNTSSTVEDCGKNPSDTLLGVVSTAPGYVGNNALADSEGTDATALVSMLGQVPVHVSNANGAIHVGDMLTYDPITGLAVKATSASMTIGEALQDFSGGTGTIQLYIHIGYYDPMGLQSNGVSSGYVLQGEQAALSNLTVSGTATISTLNVTSSATIASLSVTTSLSTAGITINGHIVTGGTTPIVTAGTTAGSGATVAITGNDESGKLTVTLGSGVTPGEIITITFAQVYGSAPNVVLTAGNSNAAQLQQYVNPTTTGFSLNTASASGLTSGQTYTFYYHVMQ